MTARDHVCGRHADNGSASKTSSSLLMCNYMNTDWISMLYASTFKGKIRKPNCELQMQSEINKMKLDRERKVTL